MESNFDKASRLSVEGVNYLVAGNYNAARLHFTSALLLSPDHPVALQNLSGIMNAHQRDKAGLSLAKRAMAAAPFNAGAVANYSSALAGLGRYEEALENLKIVLADKRLRLDALQWFNFASVLYRMGRIEEAIGALEKSLSISPPGEPVRSGKPDSRLNDYGIYTLASGELQLGLERWESRWDDPTMMPEVPSWRKGVPEWRGESLENKSLLLHHEQGFGDGIMLSRFVTNLANLGAKVVVAVPGDLVRLIRSNFPVMVVDWDDPDFGGEFDFQVHMLSALRGLRTTKESISHKPYMSAPKWDRELGPDGFRVGICWESGFHSQIFARRWRKVPLEMFFPLAEIDGVRLVSLQKGAAQGQIVYTGAESFVFDQMNRVCDFYDTAKIINGVDLVIAVDSAVAHLAGAMGKPVWMLGPYTRCWRWWNQPSGLPWYDNFHIISQDDPNSWEGPMRVLDARLSLEVEKWRGNRAA